MLKHFSNKLPLLAGSKSPDAGARPGSGQFLNRQNKSTGYLPMILAGAKSGKILFLLLGLFTAFAGKSQTISDVAVTGVPVCEGGTVTVTFNANSASGSDVYSSGTTYYVYLSNSSGNTFTQVGSGINTPASYNYGGDASTNPVSLEITIPTGVVPGTDYKISVGSTSPAFDGSAGSNASASFKIGPTSTTTAVSGIAPVTFGASSVTLSATVSNSGSGATPTGTVEFQVGSTIVGSGTLSNGVATYNYSLAGVDAGTYPITATYSGSTCDFDVSTSSQTDLTVNKAPSTTTVTLNGSLFTYMGSAIEPATVTVTGAGLNLTPDAAYADNTDAGTASASYSYVGDANHEPSSDSKTFTIDKASTTTVVSINGTSFTYDGTAQTPATVSVTGTDGLSLTPAAIYADNTDAGTATASYSYAGDANHEPSSDSKTFTIDKAATTTVVSINGTTFTYDGTAQTPATVSVTSTDGLSLTPAAIYADNTDAGTATASYSYAGDANHEPSSDSKTFTIDKASTTTVVSINGTTFTYDGTAQTPATISVTGTDGLSLTPAAIYADNTDAGTATASYSYVGDANHEPSSDSKTFTIDKASTTTVVSINGTSFTYDGTAQTPATVSVTGTDGLSLTPAAIYADNTDAGTATASYSYAGDANHEASSDSKTFTIDKANAVISVNGYSVTYDGSAQVSSFTATGVEPTPANLGSLMDVSGTSHTDAGTYTADAWSFAGDNNYNADGGTVVNTIAKANAIINVTGYNVTYDGTVQTSGFTAVGVESTPANLASQMDVSNTQHTDAGTYTVDAWIFAGDNNYNAASGSVANTINARSITITADGATKVYGDVDPALTYTVSNLVAGDAATGTLDRTAGEDMGPYAINMNTLTYGANYSETFVGNSLLISQASVSATVAADASVNYSDQVTLTANVTADNSNAMSELLANAGTVTFKAFDQSGTTTTLGQATVSSNGTATGSYVVTLAPGTYDILVDISSASVNIASVTNQSTNRVLTVNSAPTSISNSAVLQLDAKAYPNPSNGVFSVEIPKASKNVTTVRAMDIQGRVVATQQIEPGITKVQVNMQNVGAGVYWVEVKNNGQSFLAKIVVN